MLKVKYQRHFRTLVFTPKFVDSRKIVELCSKKSKMHISLIENIIEYQKHHRQPLHKIDLMYPITL